MNNGSSPDLKQLIAERREGWSLPRPFYTDPAIFVRDLERIFARYWLFVGHVSRIPQPGDFFLYNIGHDSIIVIRDKDRCIRALHNVCRHRGSRICTETEGHVTSLVCPYHQWGYDTTGKLKTARLMQEDFNPADFPLHRAHVQALEGLIFISLADTPPDFTLAVTDILPQFAAYQFAETKICQTRHYNVGANWKLIMENARECYHCTVKHPEYSAVVSGATAQDSPKNREAHLALFAERQEQWDAMGLKAKKIPFTRESWHHCIRFPLRRGATSETPDGKPAAPLLGTFREPEGDVFAIMMYPNLLFEASCDHAMSLHMTPVSAVQTHIEVNWYVRADAEEDRDYDLSHLTAVWQATVEQDWQICEDNQDGILSSKYESGPYATVEDAVEKFVRWYLDQVQP